MRTLVIGKYYHPYRGGMEAVTRQICEKLSADGNEVTVVVNNHEKGAKEETINGVRIIRRKTVVNYASQAISPDLLSGIDLAQYDVVHLHGPNPFASLVLAWRYWRTRNKPAIVITHHMEIHGRRLLRAMTLSFYSYLIERSFAVVFTSMKNAKLSRDVRPGGNVTAIPLGIDISSYAISDAERREALAWRTSIAGDSPVVGFVGRHARYKGLLVLVEALSRLPGVHALIMGDGEYRQTVEQAVADAGLADRVHFLGSVDDKQKVAVLSVLDCFVFPSTEVTEAFGVSLLEAMAVGAPVVASNLPTGVTDVAIDRHTALLAEPGNAGDLADKIQELLKNRPLAGELAKTAAAQVAMRFDDRIVSGQYSSLFAKAALSRQGV